MKPRAIYANDVSACGQYPLIQKNAVVISIPVHPDEKPLGPVKLPKKHVRRLEEFFELRIRGCSDIVHMLYYVRNLHIFQQIQADIIVSSLGQ
jgi:hypothetical protein